jgi:hypothetical protein
LTNLVLLLAPRLLEPESLHVLLSFKVVDDLVKICQDIPLTRLFVLALRTLRLLLCLSNLLSLLVFFGTDYCVVCRQLGASDQLCDFSHFLLFALLVIERLLLCGLTGFVDRELRVCVLFVSIFLLC